MSNFNWTRFSYFKIGSSKGLFFFLYRVNSAKIPLLIIDIGLPDMDGLMLLKAISVAYPDVRKIILTGNPSMENVKTALQNGAHDYVTKPVQLQEIRDTIKAQLRVFDSDIKEKYKTLG